MYEYANNSWSVSCHRPIFELMALGSGPSATTKRMSELIIASEFWLIFGKDLKLEQSSA